MWKYLDMQYCVLIQCKIKLIEYFQMIILLLRTILSRNVLSIRLTVHFSKPLYKKKVPTKGAVSKCDNSTNLWRCCSSCSNYSKPTDWPRRRSPEPLIYPCRFDGLGRRGQRVVGWHPARRLDSFARGSTLESLYSVENYPFVSSNSSWINFYYKINRGLSFNEIK